MHLESEKGETATQVSLVLPLAMLPVQPSITEKYSVINLN